MLGWEEQYMKAGGQAYIEWDRLVRRFQRASEERAAPDALLLGQDYDSVVARGVFLDLEEADNWRGMVGQIAEALASRTNQASVLQQRLTFKIEEGGGSFSLGALVMGLRLPDFRRHEMVVVRCPHGLVVPDPVAGTSQTVYCFILLVGSQERPDEHLKMLASLIARVAEDRAEAWHSAASSDDMRRKLLQHQRFVNITLTKGQPSEAFIRQAVWQLSAILPADVLIVSVERDGESIVPKGGTTLLEGDTITVLGKPGQVESLFAEYVMTSHQSSLQVALSP